MSFVRSATAAAGVPRIAAATVAVRNAAGTSASARAMVSSVRSAHGSRIKQLLWKKPAKSGLPGSWRKISPSIKNLYSCDPGSSRDSCGVVPQVVRTGCRQRPFFPVGERADQDDRLRRHCGVVVKGDLILAVRESLRGGHAEREVLLDEGEIQVSDVHFIAGLLAEGDSASGIGVVQILVQVVEVGFGVEDRPFGHRLGLVEDVEVLPVELVSGYVENDLAAAVGVFGDKPHRLAPQVHVRHQ